MTRHPVTAPSNGNMSVYRKLSLYNLSYMRSATKSQSSVPLLVGDFTTECMSTTLVVQLSAYGIEFIYRSLSEPRCLDLAERFSSYHGHKRIVGEL